MGKDIRLSNMSPELIISLISIGLNFIVGGLTILANIRISRISHLESIKKYDKNITNFELQFKDEHWLHNLIETGDFDFYNIKSKKRICAWWLKYSKKNPPVLLIANVDYNELKRPGPEWIGSSGVNVGGRSTEMVMPGDDLPNAEDLF